MLLTRNGFQAAASRLAGGSYHQRVAQECIGSDVVEAAFPSYVGCHTTPTACSHHEDNDDNDQQKHLQHQQQHMHAHELALPHVYS